MALLQAWKSANIDPTLIGYIEAHGTGTKLGDPIEFQALTDAFAEVSPLKRFCELSALKANIGHLDSAAGVAGLVKAVLGIQRAKFFPSVHFHNPNPLINFENTALRVTQRLAVWNGEQPKIAGISAFSLNGTNAHVVIEQAPSSPESPVLNGPFLFLLSAKNSQALAKMKQAHRENLLKRKPSLADLSYTLIAGRDFYEHRFAAIVGNVAELVVRLNDDAMHDPCRQEMNTIFLASGNPDISIEQLRLALAQYPVLQVKFESTISLLQTVLNTEQGKRFSVQYGIAQVLMELGIKPSSVMGYGTGNLVSRFISGKIQLDDLLLELAKPASEPSPLNEEHFCQALNRFSQENPFVLIELGSRGKLYDTARRLSDKRIFLFSLDDKNPLIKLLESLFLGGVNFNGTSLYMQTGAKKIHCPGYMFDRIRCWVDISSPSSFPTKPHRPFEVEPLSISSECTTSDTLATVISIWKKVLGTEKVEPTDSFFDLGGNSLIATQLVAKLREAVQIEIPLRLIFEAPNVLSMVEAIEELRKGRLESLPLEQTDPLWISRPEERYEPFPLTELQQAYWIGRSGMFEHGAVGTHYYIEFDSVGLDLETFIHAFHQLINRHEMLRVTISAEGTQRVHKDVPLYKISIMDFSESSEDVRGTQLAALREEMTYGILDPAQWPLFDFRVSRLPDGLTRLHFKMDYLITDALSFRIIVYEWLQLYRNPTISLPPLEASFRDYVFALNEFKKTSTHQQALDYWNRRAPTLAPPPSLPTILNNSVVKSPKLNRRTAVVPPVLWERFKTRSKRAGVSRSIALCAAFAEVLSKWSGASRFTINLTFFDRPLIHPQINSVIGDFTSTILLEVDMTPKTFEERARRLWGQLLDDMDNRYVSGTDVLRLISKAHKEPGRAIMPIVFTSLLVLDNSEEQQKVSDEALGKIVYDASQTPQILIDHQVMERDGALEITWDSMDEAFQPSVVQSMFKSFVDVINLLAANDEAWETQQFNLMPISQLELIQTKNQTAGPLPHELLHEPFFKYAQLNPERVAVIANNKRLTYGELAGRARAISEKLISQGVGPGVIVAIVMKKGWEQIVAVLAILEAGGAYLPIDAGLPEERIELLLQYGQAHSILIQSSILSLFKCIKDFGESRTLNVDTQPEPIFIPEFSCRPRQKFSDLAYIIFTSGSTGQPKGVMIDHLGATNTCLDINQRFEVGPDDRIMAISMLSFDLSVYDIFGLLGAGGAVIMPEPEFYMDPDALLRMAHDEKITIWNTVPATFEMLVDWCIARNLKLPDSLRLVMLSGDLIPITLPDRGRKVLNSSQIISLGGATEASIWSIIFPINQINPDWKSIPYGHAMVNQTFYVLDEWLEPTPFRVPGMLYIGGVGLAKGYWCDEAKTRDSFIFHPKTGERLYRTGDLGRYLPDGEIEFLGRVDGQIKLRGFRIELGEIESALLRYPAVSQVTVICREDRPGDKLLVAYVVTKDFEPELTQKLRGFLATKIPEYMIPSAFVPIESVPLTSNGKVNRGLLPLPPESGTTISASIHVEPRTPLEAALSEILKELLKIDKVSVNESFFEMGGNSLQATRFITRVRERFSIDVPLRKFFEAPNIALLAEFIELQIMTEIENMSDEDAKRYLADEDEN